MDIIRRYDRGESNNAIRNSLHLPESTLRTIRKDREKILTAFKAGAGCASARVSSGQSALMVCMEKMLVTWMALRKLQGLSMMLNDTKKKAMERYEFLKAKNLLPAQAGFIISRPTIASSDLVRLRALTLTPLLCTRMNSGPSSRRGGGGGVTRPSRYLIWIKWASSGKNMPECTYITREEKCAPGFKAFKDSFTLLLGANLTGDCKLKPVLVYHAENPHALKGYEKNSLPVHWYSNSSGWMTGHIFQEYSKTQLLGNLKEYCLSQGLPFKILMVLYKTQTSSSSFCC